MSEELHWTVTLQTEVLPCERCEIYKEWESMKYQPRDREFNNLPWHTGKVHNANQETRMADPARIRPLLRVAHTTLVSVMFLGTPAEIFQQIAQKNLIISTETALRLGMEMGRVWETRAQALPTRQQ